MIIIYNKNCSIDFFLEYSKIVERSKNIKEGGKEWLELIIIEKE